MRRILPVVEGQGDMGAVPELIRRIALSHGYNDVHVLSPHRRGDLPKVLSRFDDFVRTALFEKCPVLWVLDYDCEHCLDHKRDAVDLRRRAENLAEGARVEFVFMVQEFETLFLSDHETTRAVFADIKNTLAFPKDPEAIRDAKGWLSEARPKGSAYKATQHQTKLTSRLDLARLRMRSGSYVRFEAAVRALIECQTAEQTP